MQCLPTQSWATQRSEAEMSNISEKEEKNLDMRNKVQSDMHQSTLVVWNANERSDLGG